MAKERFSRIEGDEGRIMAEKPIICETSINSVARLDVSRRDLIKLRDLIDYQEASIRILEVDQSDLKERLVEIAKEAARLKSLFTSLFGDQIRGIDEANARAEMTGEHPKTAHSPDQITLGMSEITREQMLSIMDAIKKVSEESGGHASKEVVLSRAKDIGITRESFEDILARLRRAGALIESEGTIKLI
jgi:hypothetical protein